MVSFAEWIGQSVGSSDVVTAAPVERLAATLDQDTADWPVGLLPPLGHWLFHLPDARRSTLGRDGHPALGGFLPPIAQPRRMWAGGRVQFLHPVPIGATLTKRTTIAAIEEKQGTAGGLVLVTLRHVLSVDGVAAIEEEQDLVYLPIAPPSPPRSVERPPATRERRMIADEVLLFRFSALTFNAHRIHYDLPYTREVEGYSALVVHGPLQAMLLANFALQGGAPLRRFVFRARAPLYAGVEFALCACGADLWVRDANGIVTMTAEIA